MTKCNRCGQEKGWLGMGSNGTCIQCLSATALEQMNEEKNLLAAEQEAYEKTKIAASRIMLTTEASHNLEVGTRLDIVTAEVVIGMHLFKDIAAAWRDTFGGRSNLMQQGLKDARKAALSELRMEAHALGADAVVGIDLDYSEISGGGKSMLFLVASGTAVKLKAQQ